MNNEKKYILLFAELFKSKGGIQVFNRDFLKAMMQCLPDASFYVICINDAKITMKDWFEKRAKFICCGSKYRLWSKFKFTFALFLCVLHSKFFAPQPLIICGSTNFSPLCFIIRKLFRIEYILLTYGIEVWKIISGLKRKGLQNAALISSISRYTLSKIKEQSKDVESKLFILPVTVNGNSFYPMEKPDLLVKRYGLKGFKVLLTVGRLKAERNKGHDIVIKALKKVVKEIPRVRYLIVGKGNDIPRLEALAKTEEVGENVIFAGFVSDKEIANYYNLCDLFVMPSKGEGFGIVFLEALACGKPVIAGNKDGSRDALLDGELGILVDPDDVNAISEAIIKVFKKRVPKRLLDRTYLRRRVLEVYGLDKFKQRVKMLIDSVVS